MYRVLSFVADILELCVVSVDAPVDVSTFVLSCEEQGDADIEVKATDSLELE